MGVQIGLVGQRADLAVEVAALAARADASVVSLGQAEAARAVGGVLPQAPVHLVLVDVAAIGCGGPENPGAALGVPDGGHGFGGDPAPGQPLAMARGDARAGEPRVGAPVVVLCRSGEGLWARETAAALGCAHVVELPLGAPWLVSQLAPEHGSSLLTVVGAVGGVGATTVAIACALGAGPDCLLVDADPDSRVSTCRWGSPRVRGCGGRRSRTRLTRLIPDRCDPRCRRWAGSLSSLAPGSLPGWLRVAIPVASQGRGGWLVSWAWDGRSSPALCSMPDAAACPRVWSVPAIPWCSCCPPRWQVLSLAGVRSQDWPTMRSWS